MVRAPVTKPPLSPASRPTSVTSSSQSTSSSSKRSSNGNSNSRSGGGRSSGNSGYWGREMVPPPPPPPPPSYPPPPEDDDDDDMVVPPPPPGTPPAKKQHFDIVLSHDFCDRFTTTTKQKAWVEKQQEQQEQHIQPQKQQQEFRPPEEGNNNDLVDNNHENDSMDMDAISAAPIPRSTPNSEPRPLPPFRALSKEISFKNPQFPPTAHGMSDVGNRKKACRWRVAGLVVVGLALSSAALAIFHMHREMQRDTFRSECDEAARKIVSSVSDNVRRQLSALDGFGVGITSGTPTSAFPNVTIDDFQLRASSYRDVSDGLLLLYQPLVTDQQRDGWEAYSNQQKDRRQEEMRAHHQTPPSVVEMEEERAQEAHSKSATDGEREDDSGSHGIGRALRAGRRDATGTLPLTGSSNETSSPPTSSSSPPIDFRADPEFRPTIWGMDQVEPPGSGPYAPLWQVSPPLNVSSALNFNVLRMELFRSAYQQVMTTAKASFGPISKVDDADGVTGAIFDAISSTIQHNQDGSFLPRDEPLSAIAYPIFNKFGPGREVAGILSTLVCWRSFLTDILPDSAIGLFVVIGNNLGQEETYRVDGSHATFLGNGDLHNEEFDDMEASGYIRDLAPFRSHTSAGLDDDILYTVFVYPSKMMEQRLVNIKPILLATVVASVFAATSFLFIFYDFCILRRQRLIDHRDILIAGMAQGIFPSSIQDRLMQSQQWGSSPPLQGILKKGNSVGSRISKSHSHRKLNNLFQYFNDNESSHHSLVNDHNSDMEGFQVYQPIADVFPDISIVFIHIVNFANWSRRRQPDEVFQALDTIYSTFDCIATRRGVFKVETNGESYVAAAGLSTPQENHAVILSQFACECIVKFKSLLTYLRNTMEPNTNAHDGGDEHNENDYDDDYDPLEDMALRIGLHSGSVTGGVLSGDQHRARFQLLPGETMHVASQMARTSFAHQIQCSQATAERLMCAHKEKWLTARPFRVSVPGSTLGDVQSYWIGRPQNNSSKRLGTRNGSGDDGR